MHYFKLMLDIKNDENWKIYYAKVRDKIDA